MLGFLRQGYVRYTNIILWKTRLHIFVRMNISGIKYKYFRSNVSRILYELPKIHEGDVSEIRRFVKPGDTVVDVGANIGTIALPVAKQLGEFGKVYAIEAHPVTFSYMNQNIKINGLKNVVAFNLAIGEKNGLVEFSDSELDDINVVSRTPSSSKEIATKIISVPMMKLDDFCKNIEKISVLKIDVEGYEKFILENAAETLKKTDVVYAEYYEPNTQKFGYRREEIKSILEANGFICELSDISKHMLSVDNIIGIKESRRAKVC